MHMYRLPLAALVLSVSSVASFAEDTAGKALTSLRNPDAMCGTEFAIFDDAVQRGGFTLESIHTTAQEVKNLRFKCQQKKAEIALANLRHAADEECRTDLFLLQSAMRGREFSLESVGSNKRELRLLRIACEQAVAEKALAHIAAETSK